MSGGQQGQASCGGCVVAIVGMILILAACIAFGFVAACSADRTCSQPDAPQLCQG